MGCWKSRRLRFVHQASFMERTPDTSLRQTQSALARTRFTSGLRRVDLFQSRIASGWAESACSRRPVALAHFDTTLSRSDIASTQTDIEMTISNSLWRSINSRDTRFFDITLSPSDITLTQSDIVSSHPEISWSWQRFTPGLRTTNWAVIDRPYSSGINTVGAVYDRATSVRKSFETETG